MPNTDQDRKREAHERYGDALIAEQRARTVLLEAQRKLKAATYAKNAARAALRPYDPKP